MPAGWTEAEQISSRAFDALSVAVDADGHVHAAAAAPGQLGGGIFYLTNASGTWTEERVSDGLDLQPSVAVRAGGSVAIVFARYGRWRCGGFACYPDRSRGVFLVDNDAGHWSEPTRISETGSAFEPQLRAGRTGLHLLYATVDGWRYAGEAVGWTTTSLGDLEPAFTVDPSGNPHVLGVVTDYTGEGMRRIVHISSDPSGVLRTDLILEEARPYDATYAPLIGPDGNGLVYYSHSDWDGSAWTSERTLLRLRRGPSGWEVERQDVGSDPLFDFLRWAGSMALDEAGTLHFLYEVWTDPYADEPGDPSGDGLWYSNDRPGTQPHRVDDSQRNFDIADWVNPITAAIVIGADTRPHVLFTRLSEESLSPIGLWYVAGPGH